MRTTLRQSRSASPTQSTGIWPHGQKSPTEHSPLAHFRREDLRDLAWLTAVAHYARQRRWTSPSAEVGLLQVVAMAHYALKRGKRNPQGLFRTGVEGQHWQWVRQEDEDAVRRQLQRPSRSPAEAPLPPDGDSLPDELPTVPLPQERLHGTHAMVAQCVDGLGLDASGPPASPDAKEQREEGSPQAPEAPQENHLQAALERLRQDWEHLRQAVDAHDCSGEQCTDCRLFHAQATLLERKQTALLARAGPGP